MNNRLQQRLRAERRFRRYGQAALCIAVLLLVSLLGSIVARGYLGFVQTQIRLPLQADPALIGTVAPSHYNPLIQAALRATFPDVTDPDAKHGLYALVSLGAGLDARAALAQAAPGQLISVWLPAASEVDMAVKYHDDARLSSAQRGWLQQLRDNGAVRTTFNTTFFSRGDSRLPEKAGFLSAIVGSLLTLAVCLALVFPLGVMTAVYLEEFARKSRWVAVIEVNINNLAAVPSIVFGLLGLAVFINLAHLPRSSALVGGLTLALMVLPVIIITTRTALKAVPPSIRDAARGLGASDVRIAWDHTIPLAMPGILTGTILGIARAIGETAPLLMIGMVAFIVDVPDSFTAPATVMPVQIYLWASSAESGFAEKTAAGILVLLVLLLTMNALAIVLRKRLEVRW